MSEHKKIVIGLDTPGLSDDDIQFLEKVADTQFNFGIKLIREKSIDELAREVCGKCLQHASDLLDEKIKWMDGDAKLVRNLVEIASEANKLIPYTRDPVISVGTFPNQHSESDKKALANVMREILTEEAKNTDDLHYT